MPTKVRNRLQTIARVRGIDEKSATVEVVASTGDVARDHAIIEVAGWELDNYLKNPVVLWAHNDFEVPIARAVEITKGDDELVIKTEFDTEDPEAMRIFGKVVRGFVNAVSVRWIPLETETREIDGHGQVLVFVRQELLELSFCSVPADPGALVVRGEGRGGEPVTAATFRADDFEGCVARVVKLPDDEEEKKKTGEQVRDPEDGGQEGGGPEDAGAGAEAAVGGPDEPADGGPEGGPADEGPADDRRAHDPQRYIDMCREALAEVRGHQAGIDTALDKAERALGLLERPPADDGDDPDDGGDGEEDDAGRAEVAPVGDDFDWDAYRAEVEAAAGERAAIAVHHTPVDAETPWDGPAAMAAAPNEAATLRYMCAWVDENADPDAKSSYKFPHHAPERGSPANLAAVNAGKARLPNAKIPDGDRAGVLRHLEAHQADAGRGARDGGSPGAATTSDDVGGRVVTRAPVDVGRAGALLTRLERRLAGTPAAGSVVTDAGTRALAARVAAVLGASEEAVARELAALPPGRRAVVGRFADALERRTSGALAEALRKAVARAVAESVGRGG